MAEEPAWTDELLRSPHHAADKAPRVRRMFNAIAPRYALVNTLFSAGRDAYWRRKAVDLVHVRPGDVVLDVACGTGDLARAFERAGPACIVGVDFAHEMLTRAAGFSPRGRTAQDNSCRACWLEADALRLPFGNDFSVVSCAFGVRNFADLNAGLREMHRVLRPGGRVVILEFTRPRNALVRRAYEWYSVRVMPIAATWLSGDRTGAYRYLPRSVVSFPSAGEMQTILATIGFRDVRATPLTGGVVTIYTGVRD